MNGPRRGLWAVAFALTLTACGFTGNLRRDPGFASFGTPATVPHTDREFALSLGPVPVRLATMLSRLVLRDEPWIPDTLSDVRAVRVYTYAIDGDPERVRTHIAATKDELVADGWVPIVAVREDGGLASALVRQPEASLVRGLVVMYEDEEELVLVNVIGKIEPETFNTLMAGLEIETPLIDLTET